MIHASERRVDVTKGPPLTWRARCSQATMTTSLARGYGTRTLPPRSRFLGSSTSRTRQADQRRSLNLSCNPSSVYSCNREWRSPKYFSMSMARPAKKLCSIEELIRILVAPSNGYYELPTDPYNEVYPNIFISDGTTALCTGLLRRLGVTHVLNAAMGRDRMYCLINTSPSFYKSSGIEFHGVEALDLSSFKLDRFFQESADFIDKAIASGGKVLVHCKEGISRSATLVLAFLMLKRNLTAQEAVRLVRGRREIIPNQGFLQQLCELNERIHGRGSNEII
ncbi:dual specificity protein phosphatase 3 isoform X1 [Ixodes scapularis]|uniref:dual specificity protein phosphatase 3 isoform X1 n=2 Tax=Ixodes scapularis TaxID=6945 RepID=UPI001A9F6788|nr:dual specificity protein phosphatase 3 isoform X1 [Ixodes scapularis]